MQRQIIKLFSAAACLAPLPASAQTVLQRASVGQDCYVATLKPSTPINDQQALTVCDKAVAQIDDGFNRAATFANRADIRLRLKEFEGAVADSDQAIALDPSIAVAYLNRGAGLVGLSRYPDAITALDAAITMRTGKPYLAYYNRAIAKEALGDVAGAYHDFKMAVEADQSFHLASEQLARFNVTIR